MTFSIYLSKTTEIFNIDYSKNNCSVIEKAKAKLIQLFQGQWTPSLTSKLLCDKIIGPRKHERELACTSYIFRTAQIL